MKFKKDDWGFKIDGKTGELELRIPEKEKYAFDEIMRLTIGILRFAETLRKLMEGFLKENQNES